MPIISPEVSITAEPAAAAIKIEITAPAPSGVLAAILDAYGQSELNGFKNFASPSDIQYTVLATNSSGNGQEGVPWTIYVEANDNGHTGNTALISGVTGAGGVSTGSFASVDSATLASVLGTAGFTGKTGSAEAEADPSTLIYVVGNTQLATSLQVTSSTVGVNPNAYVYISNSEGSGITSLGDIPEDEGFTIYAYGQTNPTGMSFSSSEVAVLGIINASTGSVVQTVKGSNSNGLWSFDISAGLGPDSYDLYVVV